MPTSERDLPYGGDVLKAIEIPKMVGKVLLETTFDARSPIGNVEDRYEIEVEYVADGHSIETGSFREYLDRFKEFDSTAEDLAAIIANDVKAAVNPLWLRVELFRAPSNRDKVDLAVEVKLERDADAFQDAPSSPQRAAGSSRPLYLPPGD